MITYQWITAALGILIAGIILFLVRRDHLHGPYAAWWLLVAIITIVLGIWPQLIDKLGYSFGVGYPPVLLLVLAQGMMLIKILTMDIERSRQERKLRRLAQHMAILESLIEEQNKAKQNSGNEV
ncbi:MAG: DUF2304 domain-containing protein [Gammaproteobacteria bacterium]|nr:DUF2304 domain-containing protein [Gammaproteobacteria bacterium]